MKKSLFIFILLIINITKSDTFLVFGGKKGWIGQKLVKILIDSDHNVICAESRLENREQIINEIKRIKPDYIINAAGITGKPNVDWCEDHRQETIRTNVIGTLNLADTAFLFNIHLTNISTGCIYQHDDKHTIENGVGFTETDEPNFQGSFYSKSKVLLEKLILEYPNVLNLRVKMPISMELDKGFVGKIINYKKVINMPNSFTVLDDLLPIAIEMTVKKMKGNFNFVNPGSLTHNDVLELYKQYIDCNFKYENFSLEEQAKILKVGRSNCTLDVSKLLQYFPNIPNAKTSLINLFKKIGRKK